jgi:thiosulfate reductase cytochrome b subunit
MLLSGLKIFNYSPSLYWGQSSYSGRQPLLKISAERRADGRVEGVTKIGGRAYDTTGVLGVSRGLHSAVEERAFPIWMTLPADLAHSRRVHFFFAWLFALSGLFYVAHAVATGRLRRDLLLTRKDWRSIWPSILDHLRLRSAQGEAARRYNVLQKLSYLTVMFALLPAIVLMGLAMSPWLDSLWPGWVDWVGGRQGARTLHFVAARVVVLFVLVHVFEVVVTGARNNLRSIITGWYRIEPDFEAPGPAAREVYDEEPRE